MAPVFPIQADFSRGEISPLMYGRVDTVFYKAGLQTAQNWTILRQGGITRRAGFKFVKEVKDSTHYTRLLPFNFGTPADGTPQSYVIETGALYFRFFVNGGIIRDLLPPIESITRANPGEFRITGHGLSTGDGIVTGDDIGGMVEIQNREFTVTVTDANHFTIGVDTSSYTPFTSGGTVGKIVEVVSPYSQGNLRKIDYAQSADKLTLTHQGHPPQELTRNAEVDWSLDGAEFKDGPYFDEPVKNTNGVVADRTNGIHPFMTGPSAPSGTASALDSSATAWNAIDGDNATSWHIGFSYVDATWWRYEPAAPAVANNYWIMVNTDDMRRAPSAWKFQGWDGADWITLDQRSGEASWAPGEIRFYDFLNDTAFSKYQFSISGNNGLAGSTAALTINEMGIGYNGDFCPTITLTFDTTDNINDDDGFDANDVDRMIRVLGSDGQWRWFRIVGVTDTKTVTGRMYGYALPDLSKTYRWRLGAWRKGSYPAAVGFFQARRCFGRSIKEPYAVWMSKSFDFEDMGVSDPLVDDDAIRLKMLTGQVNAITWLADDEALATGTTDNIRVIDRANQNNGFGATNIEAKTKVKIGSTQIKPLRVGQSLLYADKFGKSVREFVYDLNSDGYVAPDLSALSEHLLSSGVQDMAFQSSPEPIAWIVTAAGYLVALTYDREQKMVGLTKVVVAGGKDGLPAVVEAVCVVPSDDRDEVYIIASLKVAGDTRRYIGQLAPRYDGNLMDVEDANYLDWSLSYDGSPTGTVTGLFHLRNLTVDALADGMVFRDLTVSSTGSVTLPNGFTASKITVGRRYRSLGETLRLATLSQDGVHLGRGAQSWGLSFDLHETMSLRVQGLTSDQAYEIIDRDNTLDPASGAMTPRSGIFKADFDTSWRENGQFRFYVDDPVPCTIRAAIIGAEGAP